MTKKKFGVTQLSFLVMQELKVISLYNFPCTFSLDETFRMNFKKRKPAGELIQFRIYPNEQMTYQNVWTCSRVIQGSDRPQKEITVALDRDFRKPFSILTKPNILFFISLLEKSLPKRKFDFLRAKLNILRCLPQNYKLSHIKRITYILETIAWGSSRFSVLFVQYDIGLESMEVKYKVLFEVRFAVNYFKELK